MFSGFPIEKGFSFSLVGSITGLYSTSYHCWQYVRFPGSPQICGCVQHVALFMEGFCVPKRMTDQCMVYFGLSPLPVTVANEGLGWDPRS